ncbi:MAG: GH116 family glycosyl-hydrolase, partial [Cyanobium sp.]
MPFGLPPLRQRPTAPSSSWQPPAASWHHPLGGGWERPYTVRYASNLDDGPNHGMPLGGLGAGCIGRAPDGTFNLWHLDGGEHWFGVMPDCQFALHEHQGEVSHTHALATRSERDDSRPQPGEGEAPRTPLGAWSWLPEGSGTYAARYPLSATHYSGVFQAEVSCEAFSPILPGDYQRTSFPVAVFVWTLRNPTSDALTVSLLLSWRNTCGWFTNTDPAAEVHFRDDGSPEHNYVPAIGRSEGQRNRLISQPGVKGILLEGSHSAKGAPGEGDGQWCLAVPDEEAFPGQGVEIFRCGRWNPWGDGQEIWEPFCRDGSLPESDNDRRSGKNDPASAALAVRCTLAPGQTLELPVVLAWDLPVTAFATGCSALRRYTDFFGAGGDQAAAMAAEALRDWPSWRSQIEAWQAPLVERKDLPEALRMALCNELYDLASGGTLWTAASAEDPVGRFGVLECLDYAWYESLDVRLYGSFALLQLWPELDKAVLRSFARAIPAADATPRPIGWYFTQGKGRVEAPRKVAGATPHDLGAPNERPFAATNYTAYQDCNLWKDLASDYVLQVWRTFKLAPNGEDITFLAECWPAAVEALHYLKTFDANND